MSHNTFTYVDYDENDAAYDEQGYLNINEDNQEIDDEERDEEETEEEIMGNVINNQDEEEETESASPEPTEPMVRIMHRDTAENGSALTVVISRFPQAIIQRFVRAADKVKDLQTYALGILFEQEDPRILIVVESTVQAVKNVFDWMRASYPSGPVLYRLDGLRAFVTAHDDLLVIEQLDIAPLWRQIRLYMRGRLALDASSQGSLSAEEVSGLYNREVYFDYRPLNGTSTVPANELRFVLADPDLPANTFSSIGQYVVEMIWNDLSEAYDREEQQTGEVARSSSPTTAVAQERHLLGVSRQYLGLLIQRSTRLSVLVSTGIAESKDMRLRQKGYIQ